MSNSFDELLERRGTGSLKWDTARDDELPLWVADMDFAVPRPVIERVLKRLEHPIIGYPDGVDSYVDSFVRWMSNRHGWEPARESVMYAPGVMPAVHRAIDMFSRAGEPVVVQSPVYFPFFHAIESHGRVVATAPLREVDRGRRLYYEMDFDALEEAFGRGAKLFLLCSPHNPVGRVWTQEELTKVAQLAEGFDAVVLADEIHCDVIFPGHRFVPFLSLGEKVGRRAWAVTAPSKTFNIPGLQTGFAIVPHFAGRERVKHSFEKIGATMPNVLSMEATIAAYEEGSPWLDELLVYLKENYDTLCSFVDEKLAPLRVVEQEGTYITWLDFRQIMSRSGLDPKRFAAAMRRDGAVWLSPGHIFGPGGEGFMRINIATPRSRLVEALERIETFTREWR
ncbi:MAG: MalY/PatB family protein [Alkalispirochaetaceae bacterium]